MGATSGHPTTQPYSRAGLLAKLTGAATLAVGSFLVGQGSSQLASTGVGLTYAGGTLKTLGADGAVGVRIAGASGLLRFRGYVDATIGSVIDSANAAESVYLPLTIQGLPLRLFGGGGTGITVFSGSPGTPTSADVFVGSGQIKAGATISSTNGTGLARLNPGGDVEANRGDGSGVYYFATGGTKYLYWDGTKFNLSGGVLATSHGITTTTLTAVGGATIGAGSGASIVYINGAASGAACGAATYYQNGGSSVMAVGNWSAIFGGSFDARPTIWTNGVGLTIDAGVTATTLYAIAPTAGLQLDRSTAGNASLIYFRDNTATKYNWIAGAQINTDNGFEITASSAVGGGTYNQVLATFQYDGTKKAGFFGATPVARPSLAAATGTATRTTFDTATVTTAQLAERVKALIDDLRGYGLEG